jgi:acyl-homoserine lactone acylase PvdQ
VLYAHYGAYRARGTRATALLGEVDDLNLQGAKGIIFDTYVPPADLWVPVIRRAFVEPGDPDELAAAVRLLVEWDRHADRDSCGATVFSFWRLACSQLEGSLAGRDAEPPPDTPEVRRDAMAALCVAVDDMLRRYGRLEVPWGEVKRLRRGGCEWALSGDGLDRLGMDTLRATAGPPLDADGKLLASGGQSAIGLVFLGERPRIYAVVAYGQRADPTSPHFADQAPLYAGHRLRRVPLTEAEARAKASSAREVVRVGEVGPPGGG